MSKLRISGVWKNNDNVITHYAIHTVGQNSISRAVKTNKADAIRQVNASTETVTWLWDYQIAGWKIGEKVIVVNNSYLRSNPDNKLTDNLDRLRLDICIIKYLINSI